MKKITKILMATTIVAALAVTTSYAQPKLGFKAGVNLSNITNLPDGADKPDMKIGFHVGGTVDLPLSDNFMISPELLFSTKGAKSEYTIFGETVKNTVNLSYIEVPILAKYMLESGLNFYAGPYLGFLAGYKETSEFDGEKETSTDKEGVKGMDLGLNVGLGFLMENGVSISARYGMGLTDTWEEITYTTEIIPGFPVEVTQPAYGKHTNIMISIGYVIGGRD